MTKPILILITGKMRSGKDTAKDYIIKKFPDFQHLALANEVKRITAEIVGMSMEMLEELKAKYRTNIVYTGDVGRKIDPDTWINLLKKNHHKELFHGNSIITDVRFSNELAHFKCFKTHKVITMRIKAEDEVRVRRGADRNLFAHPSESDLDNFLDDSFDFVYENNGKSEDFSKAIEEFLNKTFKEKLEKTV